MGRWVWSIWLSLVAVVVEQAAAVQVVCSQMLVGRSLLFQRAPKP
jgi:hypothetical protein